MIELTSPLTLVALSALFVAILLNSFQFARSKTLPPGPPRVPFFGNALQIPKQSPWLKFTDWGTMYGGFVFAKVFSRKLIIINSYELAAQVFEKRSANYADRPKRHMANISGFGRAMLFKNYDEEVKKGRKLLQAGVGSRILQSYHEIHMKEAHMFAKRLLDDPSKFRTHIRRTLTINLLRFTYGHQVESEDDILVPMMEEVMDITGKLISPNRYAVDLFPFLNLLPEGFPGTGFKRIAKYNQKLIDRLVEMPFLKVKEEMLNGTAKASFMSDHLEGRIDNMSEYDLHLLKWTATILNAAGVDTTASVITSFFLAMVRNPEVQAKAQRELDSVLGANVLPTWGDRERLPFIEGIIKESLRWHPPTPLVARTIRADDIVENYAIEAGSFIIANIWAYTHNPKVYPEPSSFKPDRFIPKDGVVPPDPRLFVFGFGRRRCPGNDLADDLLYILIATTLVLFKIVPETDENNHPIIPDVEYTTSGNSHPVPFQCKIIPRSQETAKLIDFMADA